MKQNSHEAASINPIYIAVLLLAGLLSFFFDGRFLVFEWTTTQDIPLILRLQDPGYLANDFYTQAIASSPRRVYAGLIYLLSGFGLYWHGVLFGLKVMLWVGLKALMFVVMMRAVLLWFPRLSGMAGLHTIALSLCLLLLVNGLPWLHGHASSLAGWTAVYHHPTLNPMTLALFLGLCFLGLAFSSLRFRFSAFVFLLMATVIHPVMGLASAGLYTVFVLPLLKTRPDWLAYGAYLLGACLLPVLGIVAFLSPADGLSAQVLVDAYVKLRHPHHYLMSGIVGASFWTWVVYFAVAVVVAWRTRDRRLLGLALLAMAFFVGPVALQYGGTELMASSLVAKLGPSRLSIYVAFLWVMLATILTGHWLSRSATGRSGRTGFRQRYTQLAIWLGERGMQVPRSWPVLCILFAAFCAAGTWVTYQAPLDHAAYRHARPVLAWISANTPEDAVIHSPDLDTFLLRVFARRAVLADSAFPFDFSYTDAFVTRYRLAKLSFPDTALPYNYVLLPRNATPRAGLTPVYRDGHFVLYAR